MLFQGGILCGKIIEEQIMSKKILTMQDLSCVGQCSLTVALPVLSALGVETCVLPTAVLSNHTMFKTWSYLDLTDKIADIFDGWEKNGIRFNAFLLGYLGNFKLMDVAEECFDRFSEKDAKVIIDPVFGDNGKLYGGFDMNYVKAMRKLIRRADVILPNLTEACFLADIEYREEYGRDYIDNILAKLKKYTDATIVITGVCFNGQIGEAICTGEGFECLQFEKLPQSKHGTGDIFSSVFTASYLSGNSLEKCCTLASNFVTDCIKCTGDGHFYGVEFEKVLAGKN